MDTEILFRAKMADDVEWVEGLPSYDIHGNVTEFDVYEGFGNCEVIEIDPDTICRYTGLNKDSIKIWQGSICSWTDQAYGICTGVVKFGEWQQDGSGGEYPGVICVGYYLETLKVQAPAGHYMTDEEITEYYPDWARNYSLVSIVRATDDFEVIGNIFDNPELLEMDVED